MADTTEIAWTDSTFNPWMGCTKVGPDEVDPIGMLQGAMIHLMEREKKEADSAD